MRQQKIGWDLPPRDFSLSPMKFYMCIDFQISTYLKLVGGCRGTMVILFFSIVFASIAVCAKCIEFQEGSVPLIANYSTL